MLNILDPFFILPFLPMPFVRGDTFLRSILLGLAISYLALRFAIRRRIKRYLKLKYRKKSPRRVLVMPSMFGLFSWTFIVDTGKSLLVGNISSFPKKLFKPVLQELTKYKDNTMLQSALNSKPGKLFRGFTPFYHVDLMQKGKNIYVQFYDLRYVLRGRFLHTATVILSDEGELLEGLFHPFSPENCILI